MEPGDKVKVGDQLNEGSIYPAELLDTRGRTDTEVYLVREVQKVYKSQGVDINDKHIEIVVRQMMKKVRIEQRGNSNYLPGQLVDRHELLRENARLKKEKGDEQAEYAEVILGITKASLATDSFLSAASFQETTKVLTDAALEGKTDRLLGLKENVIIGKLIPAATGLRRYRRLEIEPSEPIARPSAGGDRPARRERAGGRARPDRQRRHRRLLVRGRRRRRRRLRGRAGRSGDAARGARKQVVTASRSARAPLGSRAGAVTAAG